MQQVCITCNYMNNHERHKTCIKCREERRLTKEVDDTQQCYTVKPKTEYGTYTYTTLADGTQLYTPHKTCNICRDRDTRRRWGQDVLKQIQLKRISQSKQ